MAQESLFNTSVPVQHECPCMAPGSLYNSLGSCEWCARCKALLPPCSVCVSPPCPSCVSAAGGPVPDCPGAPPGHQVSEGSHGRAPPAAQERPAGREGECEAAVLARECSAVCKGTPWIFWHSIYLETAPQEKVMKQGCVALSAQTPWLLVSISTFSRPWHIQVL